MIVVTGNGEHVILAKAVSQYEIGTAVHFLPVVLNRIYWLEDGRSDGFQRSLCNLKLYYPYEVV